MAIAGPEAVEHPHFVWWGPVPKNLVDGRGWVIERGRGHAAGILSGFTV